MPWTLYRYILREVLKVLVTSAAVLTAVMSVAFAIMSITEAQLGAWAMVKIITYVLPGMLTIALPFAAALAGTLVYFRMSQDNEVTACAVSGISYMSLLVPVLVLGLTLSGAMFILSNWVVPGFWRAAEREGAADAVRVVMRKIEQRDVYELDDWVIHADAAAMTQPRRPDAHSDRRPYRRLILRGVAVGKLDAQRNLEDAYTAGRAVIDLWRDEQEDQTSATMRLEEVSSNEKKSGTMPYLKWIEIGPLEVPTFFRDRPRFMSLDRLHRLQAQPQRGAEVRKARRELVEAMARLEALDRAWDALSGPTRTLELRNVQGRTVRLVSPTARRKPTEIALGAAGDQKIIVRQYIGDVAATTFTAQSGDLGLLESFEPGEPRLRISLQQVAVREAAGAEEPSRAKVDVPLLTLARPVLEPIRKLSLEQVLDRASDVQNKRIANLRKRLRSSITGLVREITSRIHERGATAVNGALVLLLGATMSMLLRRRAPLTIFFWCFVPIVAAFLMIASGQHITSWNDLPIGLGLSMIWAGNVALLLIVAGVYGRLRRN